MCGACMHVAQTHAPQACANCVCISVMPTQISNFMASLLVGRLVPAELADASGMNLVDIHRHAYAHAILDALLAAGAAPPDLVSKLPLLIHSTTQVGSVHPYYCARWGFAPTCVVMPFTGDNPSTLTAFTWRSSDSDVVISLGTSDTLMALVRSTGGDAARMESKSEDCVLMGHRFIQPITTGCVTTDATAHMTLLCYQNGDFVRAAACRALLSHPTASVGDSVHRAAVATALTSADWETFADAVLEYSARMSSACVDPCAALPPLVFDMQQPEITPTLPARPPVAFVCEPDASRGCVRSTPVSLLSAAQVAHGVLASRLLGMRAHAAASGLHAPTRCILTGGASRNRAIAQMVADVWGVPTFGAATGTTNAAAIGAALRATMAVPACASAAAPSAMPLHAVAQPQCCAVRMYARMATLYEGAEAALRAGCGLPAS
ncbi:MAG: hypothetical protein EOO41_01560 [Methanobacteriota archaeon]|nr:MAG: hypothetical protein EOO41_01560 [Euryarchaeota archaeon]